MWIDDDILERARESIALGLWEPKSPMVVLGSSNDAEREADVARCKADGVPILKRYGGGGAVLLHSGCAVLSIGLWVRQAFQNKFYFERVNAAVIAALSGSWPALRSIGQRGLSDLTVGDLKVAGTSLFRSRNYLLYQGSLLVQPQIELIERYLCHPSREPDYRAGRSHRGFVAGLSDFVPGLETSTVLAALQRDLEPALVTCLQGELTDCDEAQLIGLSRRAATGRLESRV